MAVAPPQYDIAQRAANLAQIKYGGAINQATRERELQNLRNQTALDALNRWEASGQQGINQAWDIGDANLKNSREHQALDWQQAGEDLGVIWNNARTMGAAVRDDAQNYLNDLASIIGATPQALMDSTNQIQSLAAQQLERLNNYEGNRRASISERAANAASFNRMKADQATQARASAIGTFLTQLQKQRGDVQMKGLENDYMLGGRLIDLNNERGQYEVEANLEGADRQFQQLGAYNDDLLAEAELAQRAAIAQAQLDDAAAARRAAANRASQSDALDWAKFHEATRQFNLGHDLDTKKYLASLIPEAADPVNYGAGLQAAQIAADKLGLSEAEWNAFVSATESAGQMPTGVGQFSNATPEQRLRGALGDWGQSAYDAYTSDINMDMLGPSSIDYLQRTQNPYTRQENFQHVIDAYLRGYRG